MNELETLLQQYDYPLEKADIAAVPAIPRDNAKLLVYNRATKETSFDTFAHLDTYLPKGAVLVLNNTKVIPARLHGTVKTGGKVEVFCTHIDRPTHTIRAMINRRLAVGDTVTIDATTVLTVTNADGKEYSLSVTGDIDAALTTHGTTPIPPYLKHTPLSEEELRTEYQTVFAKTPGSVAAPTASLHFTDELLQKLQDAGIEIAYVTLHVNLGTFAPLTEEALETGALHEEWYEIPPETAAAINRAKKEGRPIIPVGTTALRTLESAARNDGSLQATSNTTTLFIQEGYTFTIADGLITNFHVPRSSLMMLVAALTGREKLLELYATAKAHDFTFLSFGDGMLIV